MPFIDSIVKYINDSLRASSLKDNRFQGKYLGVASIVARKSAKGQLEVLPAIADGGDMKTVEPDDRSSVIIYHRVNSNTYSTVQKSVGSSYDYKCTTEMSMLVWADADKIKMSAEKLEPLIVYGLPQRLSGTVMTETNFRNCLITPLASTMDKLQVYRGEYPQTPYFLKPNHHFFLFRYRIEATFDKDCINACLCGE